MRKIIVPLLFILLFSLLISLGLWQLDRAAEKQSILDDIQQVSDTSIITIFSTNELQNKIHYNVRLSGNYLNKQFVYDNQTVNGVYGYFVITPFRLESTNEVLLVNRGFQSWEGSRTVPDISVDTRKRTITAKVSAITQRPELKETSTQVDFPVVLQRLDTELIAKLLESPIGDAMLLLDMTESEGFDRNWQPFYGSVDKHKAYAVQWFAMAFVLLIIGWSVFRKYNTSHS